MPGWIQLYRSLKDWEWFTDVNTSHLFVYCLLRANHASTKWRGIEIDRGQFLTSLDTLAKETGLTVRQVRTALDKLKSTGELTSKVTNKNRLISVVNFERYQGVDKQSVSQLTGKRQTNDKQVTTDNNNNNKNNVNNENKYIENQFDQFWNSYPVNQRNKGSKKEALAKFKIAIKKDSFENIMQGVKAYEAYIRNTGQPNKDTFRWLNNEAWRDDYTIQSYANTRSSASEAAERGMYRAQNPDF